MPHATGAKPAKARRIDSQSRRCVLGDLCVRKLISGFGCGFAALGNIRATRGLWDIGRSRSPSSVRCGSSRRMLAKTSSTTDISRRRGLVDAGGKRGQHRRRGSLWILRELRLLALAFEFQQNRLRATGTDKPSGLFTVPSR